MPDPSTFPSRLLTAALSTVDGCPLLTRQQAFVIEQGVVATIEYTVRDPATGVPLNLAGLAGSEGSLGGSFVSASPAGAVVLRAVEVVLPGDSSRPVVETDGVYWDPAAGVIRAPLCSRTTLTAGIYRLSFGLYDDAGNLSRVATALLSVEPSEFGVPGLPPGGAPTLSELRMAVRDSASAENLLLDNLEFGADQIVTALVRPVRYWNEQPPPMRPFSTVNFPFREMWLRATVAQLYYAAAAGYARDHMTYEAGGVTVDDRNKQQAYLTHAQLLDQEWKEFVRDRKIALNAQAFTGFLGSAYGAWF